MGDVSNDGAPFGWVFCDVDIVDKYENPSSIERYAGQDCGNFTRTGTKLAQLDEDTQYGNISKQTNNLNHPITQQLDFNDRARRPDVINLEVHESMPLVNTPPCSAPCGVRYTNFCQASALAKPNLSDFVR